MEMKGLMGGFYRISEWIMRFSVTNLLWLITSIPVVYLLLSVFFSEEITIELIQTTLFLIAIVAPFTLFPSTSAMFSLARKWITGDEDAPLFKTFFINYKRNYLQSMLSGLLYSFFLFLMYVNYQFYLSQDNISQLLASLFLAFMLITSISVFNFFSLQSHLHMKTLPLLKNAILITIGKPITSILIIATNISIVYICFAFFKGFLVVFFMGSIVAYMSFYHFHRMFQKIQEKQEELAKQAELEEEQQAQEQLEASEEVQAQSVEVQTDQQVEEMQEGRHVDAQVNEQQAGQQIDEGKAEVQEEQLQAEEDQERHDK